MKNHFRPLTEAEVKQLSLQGCSAENWNKVTVKENFTPDYLFQVRFYGKVFLGVFEKELETENGVKRHSGIRNAELRNVKVMDNCLIENVGSYISDYIICNDCYISQVGVMRMSGPSRFGVGTVVHVLQEAGEERTLTLHPALSAQEAYLLLRHPSLNQHAWNKTIVKDNPPVGEGVVYPSARIARVGEICDAFIGRNAEIHGAQCLSEVTVQSSEEDPATIGPGCIVRSSILCEGAEVTDGAQLNRCFVGQAAHIGAGFTATDSVFFANCYFDNGEACSAVAGPFTVSHHKSTLLIGCMLSFANLGSGTNMSNHLYKMGPVHYGMMERGCKTASGSHLVWPARIGAFSMVMGKIAGHVDATMFPYSYLFGEGDKVWLVPAVNSMTLGTFRDILKWGERDKRKCLHQLDRVLTYGWTNPAVVEKVTAAIGLLQSLKAEQPDAEVYNYSGMLIKRPALEKGIELYQRVLTLFWGEYYLYIFHPYETGAQEAVVYGAEPGDYTLGWEDALGLPLPVETLNSLASSISSGYVDLPDTLSSVFGLSLTDYKACLYGWQGSEVGIPDEQVEEYARHYLDALAAHREAVLADLEKEISLDDTPSDYAAAERQRIEGYFEEKKSDAESVLSSL